MILFPPVLWILSLVSLPVIAAAPMPQDEQPAATADDELFKPTDQPLDPRIDAAKITEQELPPLPELVLLPLPPDHRIAEAAEQVPVSEEHWRRAMEAIAKGVEFLRQSQDESGGWMTDAQTAPTDQPERPSPVSVAVTALAVKAVVQSGLEEASEVRLQDALRFIQSGRNDDGSYEGGALSNYVTSTVASALAAVGDWDDRDLQAAVTWLQHTQWDQGEGLEPRQDWFGGAGYGSHGRPDMSNTQMMLEAMYDAGMSPSEPAFQKALAFVSRAQNLKAMNPSAWAGDDGGFIYTPANGGESMASEAAGEGRYGEAIPAGEPRSLRSYGSMTYAGFKSLLYAGLSPDDVRVRAAFDWIRRHWSFEENPGLGEQGLYYYYHAMSRALRIAQQKEITDLDGRVHNWREELIDALVLRQREDGSWVNEADRWMEAEPVLATVYSLLALEEALKPVTFEEPENSRTPEPEDSR